MKVLWVMNSPIGPASVALGEQYGGSSGGWIQTEYEALQGTDVSLCFLCTLPTVAKGEIVHREHPIGDVYCLHAPRVSYGIQVPECLQKNVQQVIDGVQPDVIHIWGTETWLSNAVAHSTTAAPRIIFIQGLIGVHQRYLGGYFENMEVNKRYLKNVSIPCKLKSKLRSFLFKRQARVEADTISKCGNIISDNQFTEAYCRSLGEHIRCFKHALLPNQVFHRAKWSWEECNKHTIFTIYGSSEEKGTHQLLKALAIVKRKYPDVRAIIPGGYQLDADGRLLPSKRDGFQQVLYNMITQLGLESNVSFTGRLNATQMAEHLRQAHLFVNTSCMEVHALSLREAMTEGVPSISSLCGSVGEYVDSGKNGFLYRFEEYENLARLILNAFDAGEGLQEVSQNTSGYTSGLCAGEMSLAEIYSRLAE